MCVLLSLPHSPNPGDVPQRETWARAALILEPYFGKVLSPGRGVLDLDLLAEVVRAGHLPSSCGSE